MGRYRVVEVVVYLSEDAFPAAAAEGDAQCHHEGFELFPTGQGGGRGDGGGRSEVRRVGWS